MPNSLPLFAVVKTLSAFPQYGIPAGAEGSVIDRHPDDEYEVEFCDDHGETLATVVVTSDQLVR